MAARIYKAFGRHIDLSKIVAVSDPTRKDPLSQYATCKIDIQLRDAPILIEAELAFAGSEPSDREWEKFVAEHAALIEAWRKASSNG
jgi:hypothetical protein